VALVLAPAAVGAKRVTIGSDLKGSPSVSAGYGCGSTDPCVIQQLSLSGHRTKARFRGTIRKWRYRTVAEPDADGYSLRLRVVRKVAPGEFRFVGRSSRGLIDEPGRHAFKTDLRVRRGDFIGLQLPPNTQGDINGFYVDDPGARNASWFPAPPNGATGSPFDIDSGTEYLYNATIKKKRRR